MLIEIENLGVGDDASRKFTATYSGKRVKKGLSDVYEITYNVGYPDDWEQGTLIIQDAERLLTELLPGNTTIIELTGFSSDRNMLEDFKAILDEKGFVYQEDRLSFDE